MTKFRIYAGSGLRFLDILPFSNLEEAEEYARNEAIEDILSYGGYHGYPHPDYIEEYNDEYEGIEEDDRWNAFLEEVESWLEWDVKEVEDGVSYDEDGEPIE